MATDRRFCRCIVAVVCAMLCISAVARAQSVVEGFDPGANNEVFTIALQPDGKVLVGGSFTMLGGGGTGTTARNYIGRLNADGSVDADFNPGANGGVSVMTVQADGKILIGGGFTGLGGGTGTTPRHGFGRLNADGTVDTDFNPATVAFTTAVVVQTDGKIVVGGWFYVGGDAVTSIPGIRRLNADGSLDPGFHRDSHPASVLAVQPDGKILFGGSCNITICDGAGFPMAIGRLNADGSVDSTFDQTLSRS